MGPTISTVGRNKSPRSSRLSGVPRDLRSDADAGRFALDPSVVGRTIARNGVPVAIVGVPPPKFLGVIQTFVAGLAMW